MTYAGAKVLIRPVFVVFVVVCVCVGSFLSAHLILRCWQLAPHVLICMICVQGMQEKRETGSLF